MAAFYLSVTSLRSTPADPNSLVDAIRASTDASAGCVELSPGVFQVKKQSAFSAADASACLAAIDGAPSANPSLAAQHWVDRMPLPEKAVLLTLLDEINRLRGWLVSFKSATAAATSLADLKTKVAGLPDMADRTVQQAIQSVRDKAGTL